MSNISVPLPLHPSLETRQDSGYNTEGDIACSKPCDFDGDTLSKAIGTPRPQSTTKGERSVKKCARREIIMSEEFFAKTLTEDDCTSDDISRWLEYMRPQIVATARTDDDVGDPAKQQLCTVEDRCKKMGDHGDHNGVSCRRESVYIEYLMNEIINIMGRLINGINGTSERLQAAQGGGRNKRKGLSRGSVFPEGVAGVGDRDPNPPGGSERPLSDGTLVGIVYGQN
ncbi:unnamed protein product [Toxocara canis]|uniref:Uncharacterized protein n=1 Tax=Toxocara canis TaxID=6265 RepID=A0A183V5Y2_TOXCA|nr:unnamed protein product [Toxocara canis]